MVSLISAMASLPSLSNAPKIAKLGSIGSAFAGNGELKVAQWGKGLFTLRPLRVSMMAKREQELVEIRQMSDEDINDTVMDLKGELFMLRAKRALRQEFKSSEFGRMRKRIARMLTIKREREIEKGIKPRESRKLDKAMKRNAEIRPPPSLVALLESKDKK
ncbi:hypothetical protein O6H91_01G176900 [Diphasiastrum complanatum]|uniref:Uncharacterized protein n=1 Tax=Diphasiastrum complanatum TaxID=34168 RepID=A0ACC2EZE7_DIPCM|nr:hypothetical protein O6H91_01G176900 [Diphasiastrum complanatum]